MLQRGHEAIPFRTRRTTVVDSVPTRADLSPTTRSRSRASDAAGVPFPEAASVTSHAQTAHTKSIDQAQPHMLAKAQAVHHNGGGA
eukprot:5285123-Prymnesium_polylepis.1